MSRRVVKRDEGDVRPVTSRRVAAAFADVVPAGRRGRKPRGVNGKVPTVNGKVLSEPRVGRDRHGRLSLSMLPADDPATQVH